MSLPNVSLFVFFNNKIKRKKSLGLMIKTNQINHLALRFFSRQEILRNSCRSLNEHKRAFRCDGCFSSYFVSLSSSPPTFLLVLLIRTIFRHSYDDFVYLFVDIFSLRKVIYIDFNGCEFQSSNDCTKFNTTKCSCLSDFTDYDQSRTDGSIINSSEKTSSSSTSIDSICFLLAYTYYCNIYSLLVGVFRNSRFSSRLS